MSEYFKDGFTNKSEAHEVFVRDTEALNKMKMLEKAQEKRIKKVRIGDNLVTTTSEIEESPLINYIRKNY